MDLPVPSYADDQQLGLELRNFKASRGEMYEGGFDDGNKNDAGLVCFCCWGKKKNFKKSNEESQSEFSKLTREE